jgi:hypothetical protein
MARHRVTVAQKYARELLAEIRPHFPWLSGVPAETWEKFAVAGSVFMTITVLSQRRDIAEAELDGLLRIIAESMIDLTADGMSLVDDCGSVWNAQADRLMSAGHEARAVAGDAMGIWLFNRLMGRGAQATSDSEMKFIRGVGGALVGEATEPWP